MNPDLDLFPLKSKSSSPNPLREGERSFEGSDELGSLPRTGPLESMERWTDCGFLLDPDLKIVWISEKAGRFFQDHFHVSAETVYGKRCYQSLQNRGEPCPDCPAARSQKTHEMAQSIMAFHDGSQVKAQAIPIHNTDGKFRGVFCRFSTISPGNETDERSLSTTDNEIEPPSHRDHRETQMASWDTKTLEDPESGLELQPEHQIFGQLQEVVVSPAPLAKKLQAIADIGVTWIGLDFCRIWQVRPGDRCRQGCEHSYSISPNVVCLGQTCLHLLASSGRYTHLDGPHGRIPLGFYRVGQLAISQQTFCYSGAIQDASAFPKQGWAAQLGLEGFIGCRIQVGDTVAVLAGFTKCRLSESEKSGFFTLGKVIEAAFSFEQTRNNFEAKAREATSARIPLTEPLIDVDRKTRQVPFSSLLPDNHTASSPETETAPVGRENPPPTADEEKPLRNRSILVADDGLSLQRFLRCVLEKAGAQVRVVGNGMEAVLESQEAVDSEKPFDLILMDMQMPIMDGDQATRRLRADGYRGAIFALTAETDEAAEKKCLGCGCDAYLAKPVKRARLIDQIQRWFNRSNSRSTSWEI